MREGHGLAPWESPGAVATAACLFALALLVIGTAVAQASDRRLAEESSTALVVDPIEVPATDIGDAVVEEPMRPADTGPHTIVRLSGSACGARTAGTGIVIAPDLVLTAAHVVGDADLLRVDAGTVTTTGEVLGVSLDGRDLALVSVDAPRDEPVAIGDASRLGTSLTVVGHPDGGARVTQVGPRVRLDDAAREAADSAGVGTGRSGADLLAIDIDVRPGDSGAPVLTADGGLAGIVVAAGPGVALAQPIDELASLVPDHMIPGRCAETA